MLVMRGCFQVGLIKQGLLHDLSKYSPTEFIVGCKYYQGNMSPNNAEREAVGYSSAWLHHKGRSWRVMSVPAIYRDFFHWNKAYLLIMGAQYLPCEHGSGAFFRFLT